MKFTLSQLLKKINGRATVELAIILPAIILSIVLLMTMTISIYSQYQKEMKKFWVPMYEKTQKLIGWHNETGGVTVYLCAIMASIILFMGIFIDASIWGRTVKTTNSLSVLELHSLLAEFDRVLEQKYDLLGVNAQKYSFLSSRVQGRFLANVKGISNFKVGEANSAIAKIAEFKSLQDEDEIVRQMSAVSEEQISEKAIDRLFSAIQKISFSSAVDGTAKIASKAIEIDEGSISELKNNSNLVTTFENLKKSLKDILGNSTDRFLPVIEQESLNENGAGLFLKQVQTVLSDEFILSHFNSGTKEIDSKRDLEHEVEYIISGIGNDTLSLEAVKGMILGIRFSLNLVYFLSDSALMSEASTLAGVTAGWTVVGAVPAQMAIIGAWCLAESILDVNTLIEGNTVPIFKSKETWVTSEFGLVGKINKGLKARAKSIATEAIDDQEGNVDKLVHTAVARLEANAYQAIEKAMDIVLVPINNLINEVGDVTQERFENCKSQIHNNIIKNKEDANIVLKKALEISEKVIFDLLDEANSGIDGKTVDIREEINKVKTRFIDAITADVFKYVDKIEDELNGAIGKGSDVVKDKIDNIFGSAKEVSVDNAKFSASFFKIGYLDYLRFFLFIGDRDKIISRVQKTVEKQMKSYTSEQFKLDNMLTSAKLIFKVNVKPIFTPKKYFNKELNYSVAIKGGYFEKFTFS